jgi:hypothetical protein
LAIQRALHTDIEILTITEGALHMDRGVKKQRRVAIKRFHAIIEILTIERALYMD